MYVNFMSRVLNIFNIIIFYTCYLVMICVEVGVGSVVGGGAGWVEERCSDGAGRQVLGNEWKWTLAPRRWKSRRHLRRRRRGKNCCFSSSH